MHDLDAGAIERGAVGLQRAVEIERDMAVAAHDRERLALQNAEVGGIAQVVALPGIAVDQQHVEAGFSCIASISRFCRCSAIMSSLRLA